MINITSVLYGVFLIICLLILVFTGYTYTNNIKRPSKDSTVWERIKSLPLDKQKVVCMTIGEYVKSQQSEFPSFQYPSIPECKEGCASIGERVCIVTLERLFNKEFTKQNPEWLINPKTGKCLELDGYNSELEIAVEYNGKQHYERVEYFQRSERDYIYQLYKDRVKEELCKKNKVFLIQVPYTVSVEQIPIFIYCKLLEGFFYAKWQ